MKMQKVENLISDIHNLLEHKYDNLQSWADLSTWPVGESRILDKTINTKIFQSKNRMRFLTQIPPLEDFLQHWHDCAETCTVMAGILGDKISGREWRVDELAVFSAGQKHIPWNPSPIETLYIAVDFYK